MSTGLADVLGDVLRRLDALEQQAGQGPGEVLTPTYLSVDPTTGLVTATFSGVIAATGTFSGDLEAAGGTFTGDLDAAGGTFTGELEAATGVFNGQLLAEGVVLPSDLSSSPPGPDPEEYSIVWTQDGTTSGGLVATVQANYTKPSSALNELFLQAGDGGLSYSQLTLESGALDQITIQVTNGPLDQILTLLNLQGRSSFVQSGTSSVRQIVLSWGIVKTGTLAGPVLAGSGDWSVVSGSTGGVTVQLNNATASTVPLATVYNSVAVSYSVATQMVGTQLNMRVNNAAGARADTDIAFLAISLA